MYTAMFFVKCVYLRCKASERCLIVSCYLQSFLRPFIDIKSFDWKWEKLMLQWVTDMAGDRRTIPTQMKLLNNKLLYLHMPFSPCFGFSCKWLHQLYIPVEKSISDCLGNLQNGKKSLQHNSKLKTNQTRKIGQNDKCACFFCLSFDSSRRKTCTTSEQLWREYQKTFTWSK